MSVFGSRGKKTKQIKPNQTRRRRALAHALGRERKTDDQNRMRGDATWKKNGKIKKNEKRSRKKPTSSRSKLLFGYAVSRRRALG